MSHPVFKSPEERIGEMRDLIAGRGAVRIDELAQNFGVSEMTIRRELVEGRRLATDQLIQPAPAMWPLRTAGSCRAASAP